jgi:hypothetical protein
MVERKPTAEEKIRFRAATIGDAETNYAVKYTSQLILVAKLQAFEEKYGPAIGNKMNALNTANFVFPYNKVQYFTHSVLHTSNVCLITATKLSP